jgi:predicted nucleic acid-binding protein
MICLDSSFLIDFLRKDSAAIEKIKILEEENFSISAISVFEVALGFNLMKEFSSAKYEKFRDIVEELDMLDLDLKSSILSSRISASLTKEGKTIDQSDCLIAGTMISNGINNILTNNKQHFETIKGINVISY